MKMDARWFGDCRCHMQDNFEIEAGTYKKMTMYNVAVEVEFHINWSVDSETFAFLDVFECVDVLLYLAMEEMGGLL